MVPSLILGIHLILGRADDAKALNACTPAPGRATATDASDQPKLAEEKKPADETIKEDSWMDNSRCFGIRLFKAYKDEFCPAEDKKNNGNGDKCNSDAGKNNDEGDKKNDEGQTKGSERRALPAPFDSPPFPSAEYQGFPLIGLPPSDTTYPLMKAIYGGPCGDEIKESRMKVYGWFNSSANWSTNKRSNTPDSYWVAPNRMALDQAALRFERETDSAQTDHIDFGYRVTGDYGIDYRYFTAGGWFSDQLLVHNKLYGWDLTEVYGEIYIPWVAQGMKITIGRWIATPDIETQFSPDNFMGTHGDCDAQRAMDNPSGPPFGRRHGALVCWRGADGYAGCPLGVEGQQRFLLHRSERDQRRALSLFRPPGSAGGAPQLQHYSEHLAASLQRKVPDPDGRLLHVGV